MRKVMGLACVVCAIAILPAWALGGTFTITPLVLEGDSIAGIGNVTSINNIAVNSSGSWLVEADTDHADTTKDTVLIRDGGVVLREDDALSSPPGARLSSLDSVTLNDLGNSGFNHFLRGTAGTGDDSGVYWNDVLVLQESNVAPSGNPGDFTPGTPAIGFFDVKINNANQLSVVISVDDPNIATTVDRGLLIYNLNAAGGVIGHTTLAKEGDLLPGQTETVADFGTGPHQSAFNNNGDLMFFADLNGDTARDGVIYSNSVILAQEGENSPIAGRPWSSLASPRLDINDNGDYVFSGSLSGDAASNLILIKNGAKFIQEGDTLAAIGGTFTFTSFGSGPLEIGNSGDVLWYGDWNDPDTTRDKGLFLNDVLLVQEGVTEIAGSIVDTIRGVEDGYHMSSDGRYIIFEAILTNGTEGAFMILIPEPGSLLLLLAGAALVRARRR